MKPAFGLARAYFNIPNVFLVKNKTKSLVLRNPSMWTSRVFLSISLTLWGQEHDGETFKENHVLHGSKHRKWIIDELHCNEESQIERITKTWGIQFCNKVLKSKARQYILLDLWTVLYNNVTWMKFKKDMISKYKAFQQKNGVTVYSTCGQK